MRRIGVMNNCLCTYSSVVMSLQCEIYFIIAEYSSAIFENLRIIWCTLNGQSEAELLFRILCTNYKRFTFFSCLDEYRAFLGPELQDFRVQRRFN